MQIEIIADGGPRYVAKVYTAAAAAASATLPHRRRLGEQKRALWVLRPSRAPRSREAEPH